MRLRLRLPMSTTFGRVPRWPPDVDGAAGMPLILLYHSVERVLRDPWGLRVRPRHFAEQMAVLRAHALPMPLADLHAALDAGRVPARAVAVTFDDGYRDNLVHALPIMQRFQVPGTVFVSSGYVGNAREYWSDELERLVLSPPRLPRDIRLDIAGEAHRWQVDEGAALGRLRAWRARHWFAWEPPATARHRAFLEMWTLLRAARTVESREHALDQLRAQVGQSAEGRPTHRCCTADELRQLAGSALVEIGAHTVLHPSLGHIGVQDQRREIFDSKAALEHLLGRSITSFAYPYGTREDYSADTISLLREAGFARSCSNFPEPLNPGADRFQLPRRVVMDWSGPEFVQRLARWFGER
jgi:peptidoglycan/xylan/chitin deacetylase (PgdA/CDA1 family)